MIPIQAHSAVLLPQKPFDLPMMGATENGHTLAPAPKRRRLDLSDTSSGKPTAATRQSNNEIYISATTESAKSDETAAQKVFGIVELVEMILLRCGGREGLKALYGVVRVSKTFQQTMTESCALRQAMWLQYDRRPAFKSDTPKESRDRGDPVVVEDHVDDVASPVDQRAPALDTHDENLSLNGSILDWWEDKERDAWYNAAMLNPLLDSGSSPFAMLDAFSTDWRLDEESGDFDLRLTMQARNVQQWLGLYGDWKPTGASWERTLVASRPIPFCLRVDVYPEEMGQISVHGCDRDLEGGKAFTLADAVLEICAAMKACAEERAKWAEEDRGT